MTRTDFYLPPVKSFCPPPVNTFYLRGVNGFYHRSIKRKCQGRSINQSIKYNFISALNTIWQMGGMGQVSEKLAIAKLSRRMINTCFLYVLYTLLNYTYEIYVRYLHISPTMLPKIGRAHV